MQNDVGHFMKVATPRINDGCDEQGLGPDAINPAGRPDQGRPVSQPSRTIGEIRSPERRIPWQYKAFGPAPAQARPIRAPVRPTGLRSTGPGSEADVTADILPCQRLQESGAEAVLEAARHRGERAAEGDPHARFQRNVDP